MTETAHRNGTRIATVEDAQNEHCFDCRVGGDVVSVTVNPRGTGLSLVTYWQCTTGSCDECGRPACLEEWIEINNDPVDPGRYHMQSSNVCAVCYQSNGRKAQIQRTEGASTRVDFRCNQCGGEWSLYADCQSAVEIHEIHPLRHD